MCALLSWDMGVHAKKLMSACPRDTVAVLGARVVVDSEGGGADGRAALRLGRAQEEGKRPSNLGRDLCPRRAKWRLLGSVKGSSKRGSVSQGLPKSGFFMGHAVAGAASQKERVPSKTKPSVCFWDTRIPPRWHQPVKFGCFRPKKTSFSPYNVICIKIGSPQLSKSSCCDLSNFINLFYYETT